MAFTGSPHWANTQHGHQHKSSPGNAHTQFGQSSPSRNPLNPSVGSFQPPSTEMQRYQPGNLLTPPPSAHPASLEMMQVRNLAMVNHFSHTHEMASLERRTKQNQDGLNSLYETVGRDVRSLQQEIIDLKEQIHSEKQREGLITRKPMAGEDLTPPNEFIQNYSKDTIAKVYLEQAEDYELTATKLRAQAEELCGGVAAPMSKINKMLEESNGTNGDVEIEFACCGTTFGAIGEMLDHISDKHGSFDSKTTIKKRCDDTARYNDLDSTPTHVPPPRPQNQKDVKQPYSTDIEPAAKQADSEEKTPTQQAFDANDQDERIGHANPSTKPSNQLSVPVKKAWVPLAVRRMPPPQPINMSDPETFTFDFLKTNLGGYEWSPGFYFIPNTAVQIESYWILEPDFEPYLPNAPGQHGAKLTAFFRYIDGECASDTPEEHDYMNVPVFIKTGSKNDYVYYGNYSQTRFSDKLDVDRLLEDVPEKVLRHHAEELANPGRPEWLTHELMENFWPKPQYDGPLPTDSPLNTPTTEIPKDINAGIVGIEKCLIKPLSNYLEDLKDWKKDAEMRVKLLTAQNLMDSFQRTDSDEERPLRLYLEYMQSVGFDDGFYKFLKLMKADPEKFGTKMERGRTRHKDGLPPGNQKGKMVRATNGMDTLHLRVASTQKKASLTEDKSKNVKTVPKKHPQENDSDTKSTATAVKMETKDLPTPKPKPVKDANENSIAPITGDMGMAKKLQQEFQKGKGGAGAGKPPHMRKN